MKSIQKSFVTDDRLQFVAFLLQDLPVLHEIVYKPISFYNAYTANFGIGGHNGIWHMVCANVQQQIIQKTPKNTTNFQTTKTTVEY